jgi:3-phosphoshikimate 1-carboxyvinyltransferase
LVVEAANGLVSRKAAALSGRVAVPGDKSISHRALMLGGLAIGETVITGLLEGEDVLATAASLAAMGAKLERDESGIWRVHGVGVGGLAEPEAPLDLGNAGTATRLLMGILATHPFTSFMTGDASLRSRPMARVMTPLGQMGARFVARSGNRLPLAVIGTDNPVPVTYTLPVASAQVKSAILLAGMNTPGSTSVIEPQPTRDHTERMAHHFGSSMSVEDGKEGRRITVTGPVELKAAPITVPGDPSSAAFPLVAALLVENSDVTIAGVGTNPLRAGIIKTLIEMGGAIELQNQRIEGGEPVADLRVRSSALRGVDVPAERAPSMIDEYLVLAVACACAQGKSVLRGLSELRVKESDRLAAIAENLAACGAKVEIDGDDLTVHGQGRPPRGGATVATRLDHRIAMAFLVLGAVTDEPVAIDDGRPIATSFPGFTTLMNGLGCHIEAGA